MHELVSVAFRVVILIFLWKISLLHLGFLYLTINPRFPIDTFFVFFVFKLKMFYHFACVYEYGTGFSNTSVFIGLSQFQPYLLLIHTLQTCGILYSTFSTHLYTIESHYSFIFLNCYYHVTMKLSFTNVYHLI